MAGSGGLVELGDQFWQKRFLKFDGDQFQAEHFRKMKYEEHWQRRQWQWPGLGVCLAFKKRKGGSHT
jgi:hypothetical protein